ncbi:hypothetical protein KBX71_05585 [Micromonospora sp. D93]|uniref:hypothetical protein n=1 Tax=Micromonospora sp. D93 TaxID=2824886 RepID=UPI001B396CEC|nr:hypothetical protein [Micromonospora sp. D93]MBQ1017337.1 hypothetical protein [Micromonospora sp. D93]
MVAVKAGDVVFIGPDCSVQFTGDRALMMRLGSIGEVDPYNGWVWVSGYVLDARGLATAKRELYVIKAGLRVAPAPTVVSKPGPKERYPTRTGQGRASQIPAVAARQARPGVRLGGRS